MDGRRVTVGMDGSVGSFRALDAAAAEAELRRAVLEVVCCVREPAEAAPVLESAIARLTAGRPWPAVEASAVIGDPVEVLAERSAASLLTVVGSRCLAGVPGRLLHSVSRRLATRTRGPLLVVRGRGVPAHEASGAGDVLLCLESDDDCDAALFAFEEAELRRTGLRVLHTWTYRQAPPPAPGPRPAELPRDAARHRTRTAADVPAEAMTAAGTTDPGRQVGTAAARAGTCRGFVEATGGHALAVIAAHRGHAWKGRQFSPVTDALLRQSLCPVVVVPSPAA